MVKFPRLNKACSFPKIFLQQVTVLDGMALPSSGSLNSKLGLKMNIQTNPALHRQCERAFAKEIATTLKAILRRQPALSSDLQESLLSQAFFGVCTHLSGSAFAGRIEDKEIYPVLVFNIGEQSDSVVMGESSGLHEIASSLLAELEA